jgi:hypothetical protein
MHNQQHGGHFGDGHEVGRYGRREVLAVDNILLLDGAQKHDREGGDQH